MEVLFLFNSRFFNALNIHDNDQLKIFSNKSKVSIKRLKYYAEECIFPHKSDLDNILKIANLTEVELRLKIGIFNASIINALQKHAKEISKVVDNDDVDYSITTKNNPMLVFKTELGRLYKGDCLSLINEMERESIDLIFADPPFNLNKKYESGINDNISKEEYLKWTEKWVTSCIDILKPGGSFLTWNIPIWNTYIANILNKYLSLKHWIAVDIKCRLPIQNRLYPAHYSLLYYIKGQKANTFNPQRIPLDICRHCGGEIKDYGGYKSKLNKMGINLSDIWYDIPPVRHSKYKTRHSNELSLKLLERIISLTTNENDIVFDPFGGSGTSYIVSEILKRRWIGIEIGEVNQIIERFDEIEKQKEFIHQIQSNKNKLFTEDMKKLRIKNGFWLPETLKNNK